MSNALMAPRKNKRSEASKTIAQAIIDQYHPACAEDMQDTLRDIFGPMFESMLQGEMNCHLGYIKMTAAAKKLPTAEMVYGLYISVPCRPPHHQ